MKDSPSKLHELAEMGCAGGHTHDLLLLKIK